MNAIIFWHSNDNAELFVENLRFSKTIYGNNRLEFDKYYRINGCHDRKLGEHGSIAYKSAREVEIWCQGS